MFHLCYGPFYFTASLSLSSVYGFEKKQLNRENGQKNIHKIENIQIELP